MVLDSVSFKAPAHDTELLYFLLKLERFNSCIETIMHPGSRQAAHFEPVATVISVLHLREAFPCDVNFCFCGILSIFDASSYKNLKPFKTFNGPDNS